MEARPAVIANELVDLVRSDGNELGPHRSVDIASGDEADIVRVNRGAAVELLNAHCAAGGTRAKRRERAARRVEGLRDAVAAHPSLTLLAEQSATIGGFGRSDYFSYPQRFGGAGAIANRVFVEAGTASGRCTR